MRDPVSAIVSAFSESLKSIPPSWSERERLTRTLLPAEPLEQMVTRKLLEEGVEQQLARRPRPENRLVLFMDRRGGGEAARAAAELMPLIGRHWGQTSFVLVSFSTPDPGVGALIRSSLTQKGAEHGVSVHLVAHNRPFGGLALSEQDADALVSGSDLTVTFAASGAMGLHGDAKTRAGDRLLERSHLAVLSYTDPESVVAELPRYAKLIEKEPSLSAIRFRIQVEADGAFEDFGSAVLGDGGDAKDRLWVLIDNARRRRYQLLIEPLRGGSPGGIPLVCPCQTVVKDQLGQSAMVEKVLPAGATFAAVARGRKTLV